MITPRFPAGRIYYSQNKKDLIISIRGNLYSAPSRMFLSVWFRPLIPCPLYDEAGEAGYICREDETTFAAVLQYHRYVIPAEDIKQVIRCNQLAAPLIDPDIRQQTLAVI